MNSYKSVNKCSKLQETVRFNKTYGNNVRFLTFKILQTNLRKFINRMKTFKTIQKCKCKKCTISYDFL